MSESLSLSAPHSTLNHCRTGIFTTIGSIMDSNSIELIRRLSELSSKQPSTRENAENTRNEALQLSRKLANSLEKPANVAVDLAFLVFHQFFM